MCSSTNLTTPWRCTALFRTFTRWALNAVLVWCGLMLPKHGWISTTAMKRFVKLYILLRLNMLVIFIFCFLSTLVNCSVILDQQMLSHIVLTLILLNSTMSSLSRLFKSGRRLVWKEFTNRVNSCFISVDCRASTLVHPLLRRGKQGWHTLHVGEWPAWSLLIPRWFLHVSFC